MIFQSLLRLRPGSNTFIVISPITPTGDSANLQSDDQGIINAAIEIGKFTGANGIKTVSIKDTGLGRAGLFLWGDARPVTIAVRPTNATLKKLNSDYGSPFGPNPRFLSVSIDWRGIEVTSVVASDTVYIPKGNSPVTGDFNYPDGDYESFGEIQSSTESNQIMSEIATATQQAIGTGSEIMNKIITALMVVVGAGVAIGIATRR
jgi:hypothetical protein